MNRNNEKNNIPATPLNNVHFGLVFYCPPKVNPCRIVDLFACGGRFYLTPFHGGKAMRNLTDQYRSRTDQVMSFQTSFGEDRQKQIKQDSQRFEEHVRKERQRLGLEVVSNA